MAGTFTTFDLSGITGLPNSIKVLYQNYWTIFEDIQAFNLNISTLRSTGNKTYTYREYASYAQQTGFINGRMLHIQRYPNSNWAVVPKD